MTDANIERQDFPQNPQEWREFISPSPKVMAAFFAAGLINASIGEIRNDYSGTESATVIVGITAVGLMFEPCRKLGLVLESKIDDYWNSRE